MAPEMFFGVKFSGIGTDIWCIACITHCNLTAWVAQGFWNESFLLRESGKLLYFIITVGPQLLRLVAIGWQRLPEWADAIEYSKFELLGMDVCSVHMEVDDIKTEIVAA